MKTQIKEKDDRESACCEHHRLQSITIKQLKMTYFLKDMFLLTYLQIG